MRIDLYTQQGKSNSPNANSQRTVNFTPMVDPGSKSVKYLLGSPGLTLVATLATSECRGLRQFRNVGYAVYGNKFYSISSGFVVTERGTLTSSTGPVTISGNGLQVCVCDDPNLYVYDVATTTFAAVTDPDFPGASAVDYMDNFGLFTQPNSQVLWVTGLADFTSVDALDFASAEASPDYLIRPFVDGSTAYLFGQDSIEPWYNSGAADFPLTRISGGTVDRGLGAKFSVAAEDNAVFFLGDDGIVYRLSGSQLSKISTPQVDYAVSQMADFSDARGWTYSLGETKFYVLTFPTAAQTWLYDFATQLWHERESYLLGRWRAEWSMQLGGRIVVGDYSSGKLYYIDPNSYTEDGETIVSTHVFPNIHSEQRIPHNHFEVDIQAGVGLNSGQGSDPIMLLSWSDDGGHTWSNEIDMKMGKIGEYKRRCEARRLGSSLDRRYKISVSDPVKRVIHGAYLNGRGA